MSVAILDGPTVTGFIEDAEVFDRCVNQWFDTLDIDGDGVLSRDELHKGFGKSLTVEYDAPSEEEINGLYDAVFGKFDADQNGMIDREEYRSLVREIMHAMARGIGNSPVQVVLASGSLLANAVEHELAKNLTSDGEEDESAKNVTADGEESELVKIVRNNGEEETKNKKKGKKFWSEIGKKMNWTKK